MKCTWSLKLSEPKCARRAMTGSKGRPKYSLKGYELVTRAASTNKTDRTSGIVGILFEAAVRFHLPGRFRHSSSLLWPSHTIQVAAKTTF
jgi:hypothetical protein